MQPIRDDEIVAKELLYKTIKKHLDSVGKQIDSSHREIIWQTLVQQLSHNEDILAKKSIQALKCQQWNRLNHLNSDQREIEVGFKH